MVWSRHPMSGNVVFWEARVHLVRMRWAAGLLGAGALVAATLTGSALTAHAATPVEINSQNPVTAEPPVSRPHTKACTVSLATDFPSNTTSGAPQNFTGTLTPPAACPGPWSKVVLDWTTQVQGRQFDRSGELTIGGVTVYFGTTYEPDPAGITYHFAKDLTEYSSVFRTPQPYNGGIGNFVNSTDTGVYDQTVTITFYAAGRADPAPAEPNDVIGLGAKDAAAATPTVDFPAAGLPRNIVGAYLEVYIKGNGCDEQWFTDVPDDVAAKYAATGLCGHGAYREVSAAIDGTPAGVTQYFPYIFTGGIVPTLWRPIPAIGTFDFTPELLNVTPFVGRLVDGGSHTVALTVANAGDVWNLEVNLLLYTDPHATQTSGALTEDTIAPAAVQSTSEQSTSTTTTATMTASRSWTVAGYVDTSRGRIPTSVTQQADFRNVDTVSAGGSTQDVREIDAGWTRSVSGDQVAVHTWSYPVSVTETFQGTDDNNFSVTGTVWMRRQLSDRVAGQTLGTSTDTMWSTADDARSNGVTVAAGGTEWQHFAGTDDTGRWYDHYIAAQNGYVTVDRLRTS
ncbi:MAG TPA: peptide-N4-asparagine amidase [Streptosporangiaceae bacterium]|nr:peptide-N4-asparagine amidase [Streptosporangiaceae bacterium]